MPHEVLDIMMKHLEETRTTDKQGKAWDLVAKWCIVMAQKDAQGDSLVSFKVEAVTEGDDSYFGTTTQHNDGGAESTRTARGDDNDGPKHTGTSPVCC